MRLTVLIKLRKHFLFSRHSTKSLVGSASKSGVRHFIYMSTVHVYSRSLNGLITEESKTENDHPYALCNLEGEAACLNLDKQHGMKTSIIRLANSFGPPKVKQIDCWHLLINNLVREAVEKHHYIKKFIKHIKKLHSYY